MYVYVHVYVYIYIHIYTQTNTVAVSRYEQDLIDQQRPRQRTQHKPSETFDLVFAEQVRDMFFTYVLYVCVHVCVWMNLCMHMCVCVYVCVCVCFHEGDSSIEYTLTQAFCPPRTQNIGILFQDRLDGNGVQVRCGCLGGSLLVECHCRTLRL